MDEVRIKENSYCLFLFSWDIHSSVLEHINKIQSLFYCTSQELSMCMKESDGWAWEEDSKDPCVGNNLDLELPADCLDAAIVLIHWAEGTCFVYFRHVC